MAERPLNTPSDLPFPPPPPRKQWFFTSAKLDPPNCEVTKMEMMAVFIGVHQIGKESHFTHQKGLGRGITSSGHRCVKFYAILNSAPLHSTARDRHYQGQHGHAEAEGGCREGQDRAIFFNAGR